MQYSVLVCGDFPTGNTGLGTVMGEAILPALKGLDVHVLAVNYYGDPHPFEDVKAYPADAFGHPLGMNRIANLVDTIRPDVIFLFGDLPVIRDWVAHSLDVASRIGSKYVAYYPVDAEGLRKADLLCLKDMTSHTTYTQFAKEQVEKEVSRWNSGSIEPFTITAPLVAGHGVNTSVFYPMERERARELMGLFGLTPDTLICLNANRNQPRKRIDLSILGYVEALKLLRDNKKDVDLRLWLHMAPEGEHGLGWQVKQVFYDALQNAGFDPVAGDAKLILTSESMNSLTLPPAYVINQIYNCCDIGINTAEAEGWGLVTHEHAATGAPQITTRYASLEEMWKEVDNYLSIRPCAWGIDRERCNKRVVVDVQEIGDGLYDLAIMSSADRMEIGKRFYQKAVSMQWDSVQATLRAMVDSALPVVTRRGRRQVVEVERKEEVG